MHRLLEEVLKNLELRAKEAVPAEKWQQFLNKVNDVFGGWESNRQQMEQSLAESSKEMQERLVRIDTLYKDLGVSEAMYRAMSEASPLGVFMLDEANQTLFANPTFAAYVGLTQAEIVTNGWESVIHPEDREWLQAEWKRAFVKDGQRTMSWNLRFVRRQNGDSKVMWTKLSAAAIINDRSRFGIIGTLDDISENKLSEDLLKSQAKIFDLITRGEDLRSICDEVLRMTESLCEGMACSIMLLNDDASILSFFTGPSLDKEFTCVLNEIHVGTKFGPCATAMYHHKPTYAIDLESDPLWESCRHIATQFKLKSCWSFPLADQSKKDFGSLAIYFKTKMEPTPHYTRVIELTRHILSVAFTQYNIQKKFERDRILLVSANKMASLGEMAGGIAHEINNPLAIIHGYSEVIIKLLRDAPPDVVKIREFAEKINGTVTRMTRIVAGLRSFSRDGSSEEPKIVPVDQIISETMDFCRERLRHARITVNLPPKNEALMVYCRPVEISQVLLNLMSNSSDAIEHLGDKWIRVEVVRKAEFIELSVVDSGKGIPHDIQEKMMQPFFTTKEVGKGTGLGLSICKGIVEGHGGAFYIDNSSPNTKITFSVPCQKRDIKVTPKKSVEMEEKRRTILVVDDERELGEIITFRLEHEHFKVIFTDQVDDAIRIFTTTSIDLVLSDVRMPGKTGMELLTFIRKASPKTPVFLITGFSDFTAASLKKSGALEVFNKPINFPELIDRIKKAL